MGRTSESSKVMMRQLSHASTGSNSTSSPKGRLNFFKKWPSSSGPVSREDPGSSEKICDADHQSDKIVSPIQLPELEITRSSNGMPSPDSTIGATHDTEYLHLKENIRRLSKATAGPDPKKVDAAWEVYKKMRDESLQLSAILLQKSQNNGRNASLDFSSIGPSDTRSSFSGSVFETSLPFQMHDEWLQMINEYKSLQETMLENIRTSLLATYKSYEPDLSQRQFDLFLTDKVLQRSLIAKWNQTSIHRMKSEKLGFWPQYQIRAKNFDTLRLDLLAIEKLSSLADKGQAPNMAIREYVISKNGDTILEFANTASEIYPILRFRVSSHLLAESSPLFSQIFSPKQPGTNKSFDMMNQLPPPPSRYTCKDGMEVNVYRMPQIELNKDEALKILLHAAHNHQSKVPHDIEFRVFVSIAEVCLRYRCTSPVEIHVEYIWLRQWESKVADESDDGMLLISYVFGIQGFFTRISKSAILNAVDDDEIQGKEHWPQIIRDKIKATRAAKLAQIRECCTNAIEEYFRPPSDVTNHQSSVGPLQLTTVPRCPKGSHLCDATNLGWLMLVYNELRVLESLMNTIDFPNLPRSPKRSLKELLDCMRLMPSAPQSTQVHSGICDYAPVFRSAINDIYNSVPGLTLRDVSGRDGWALSKHRAPARDQFELGPSDAVELEAPLNNSNEPKNLVAMSKISLCILSHVDNLEDLNSAAMIDRNFYRAYKRNEATLLKNVMKAERRRTLSFQAGSDVLGIRKPPRSRTGVMKPNRPKLSTNREPDGVKYLAPRDTMSAPTMPLPFEDSGGEELDDSLDLYDSSPLPSPVSRDDISMSHEEAQRILWPDDYTFEPEASGTNVQMIERNVKFRVGDVSHIEDKARIVDDEKNLRDEKDKAMGLGIHKK